jgi:hypothetical protein
MNDFIQLTDENGVVLFFRKNAIFLFHKMVGRGGVCAKIYTDVYYQGFEVKETVDYIKSNI